MQAQDVWIKLSVTQRLRQAGGDSEESEAGFEMNHVVILRGGDAATQMTSGVRPLTAVGTLSCWVVEK
jgi:hypothetical protein